MKMNIRIEDNKLYNIAVILSLSIGYFISFMGGILFFIFFSIMSKRVSLLGYLVPVFAIGVISFTNYSDWQSGDYDIVRYYNVWSTLSSADNLQQALLIIYTCRTDYLFWFIVFLFSKVFPSDPRWFGFVFSSLISLLLMFSFANFCKKENCSFLVSKKTSLLLFALGFFCLIRFYDFTNAYRQHLAISIVIFIISLKIDRKKTLIPLLLTLGVHWSMIFVIIPYLIFFGNQINAVRKYLLIASAAIGLWGLPLLLRLFNHFDYALGYLMNEELGIDKKIMVIQIITVFIVLYLVYSTKFNSNIRTLVLSMTCLSLLFIFRSTIMIRMAYNWTDILVVLSPLMFYKLKNIPHYKYSMCLVWFFFMLYNLLNINNGEFEYQLFSSFGVWSSVYSVFNSSSPF